jgi:hypothetical protein
MCHVENHRHIRIESIRKHPGAVTANLLLNAIGNANGSVKAISGRNALENLSDNETPDSIIERATCEASRHELGGTFSVDHGVADSNPAPQDLISARRANVDKELVKLRNLLRLRLADMDRRIAQYAEHRTIGTQKLDSLASRGGSVHASDAPDVQEAIVGNVLHHEADLIGMSLEHDHGRLVTRIATPESPRGTVRVRLD